MARMATYNFPEAVKVGLRKLHLSTLKDIPIEFRSWANVINGERAGSGTGKAFFEDLQVASFGTYAPKPQGDPIQYDVPVEGNLVRYTPYAFALGFRATREMKADGLYGLFDKMATELAWAAKHQMEVQAMRPINRGFATTGGGTGLTTGGFDTLPLFSTSHTLIRGGTYSNRLATDPDLSVTGLELAYDLMEGTLNESGMPTPMTPKTLLIPWQLRWVAKELNMSELKPYTANNEINPIKGETQYEISHYFEDPDAWVVLADKTRHDINVWIREQPDIEFGDDFDTKDTKISGFFRMASGHGDWRGAVASTGT